MALSKVDYNSLNVTAAASKALKWNSSANGFETGDVGGSLVLLETQTADDSATLDFTSNIDSTYDEYVFKFINIHPATDNTNFSFQADTGTNTSYGQTITSTFFNNSHGENDGAGTSVAYESSQDQAQGTAFQRFFVDVGNDNDQNNCGYLHIFNPSSTTFVKHFYGTTVVMNHGDGQYSSHIAGYFNTTTALARVRFKMESGNIGAGVVKMYGVV